MNRPTMMLLLTAVLLCTSPLRGQPVKIKIGYDTTRLTGPLKADGTVDYVAALNRKYGRGVTPANNAAVAIIEARGRESIGEERRATRLRLMGVRLPDGATYFQRYPGLQRDVDRAIDGPWPTKRVASPRN